MSKKRKKRKLGDAEVPMSAMIDVVFLLLIYFIVTQKPIIDETLLSCDLPAPGGAPPDKPPVLKIIGVKKMSPPNMNMYYMDHAPWPLDDPSQSMDLRRYLVGLGKYDKDQTIIIDCGPNASHQKLVKILDTCAEANLSKLNVVNDEGIPFNPPSR